MRSGLTVRQRGGESLDKFLNRLTLHAHTERETNMATPAIALSYLEPPRIAESSCGVQHSAGIVRHEAYRGQKYTLIAARRGFPGWYRVILTDETGHVAERDLRAK